MRFSLKAILILVAIAGLFSLVYISIVVPFQQRAQCQYCRNRMRMLGLVIHNYESGHGHLPQAVVNGSDGLAWHSWRSAILPIMEYDRQIYDSAKPWDSPANLQIVEHYTNRFSCPTDREECVEHNQTSYLAVTGPETVFPHDGIVTFLDITDGPANTIMFVETLSSRTRWTEPRDLDVETMSFKVNDVTKPGIASRHILDGQRGANVCFVDGEVLFMTEAITPDELKALLTIAGGENVTRADLVERGILK